MRITETIRKNWKLYLINITALFTVYVSILNTQLTSDILYSAVTGEMDQAPGIAEHLSSGRYTNYFISWILRLFHLFGIDKVHHQWVLQLLGIAIYAVAACMLYLIFAEKMKLEKYSLFLNVLVWICFVNPFMVETFVYVSFDWAIGILLAVLAAKYLLQKRWLCGGIFAFLAVSTYQTNIIMTLLFCVTAIFIENHAEFKKLFVRIFQCGIISFLAALINIMIPKLCVALQITDTVVKETGVNETWSVRLQWIAQVMYLSIVRAYGMLPRFFIPVIVLVAALLAAVILYRRYSWKKIWIIAVWGIFALGCMCVPYAPCFIASAPGFPQRTLLSLFMAVSMILICTYAIIKDTVCLKGYHIGIVLLAGIMLYSTETGIQDCYIANAIDFYEARCIQDAITEYEETSGNEITYIAVHRPGSVHYAYEEQHFENVYTLYAHRLFYDAWSDVNLLNYMFDEQYERINMDELYTDDSESYQEFIREHWEGKYWDHLDIEEQIIFDGDTMYWSLY